ncbi:MAG: rod shape-determining protein MreC [Desulfobacteraceae bacterium]|nr:MAG: rod shape-determining protein MreC [Desulfobacteraceae bacterium]
MFSRQIALIVGLIVLITLSILLLSISSRRPYPDEGSGRFAIAVVAPFQKMISQTTRFLCDIWQHYFFLISVADENDRLRAQAQQALALQHRHEEVLQANARLRQLLELGQEVQQRFQAAQVVGKDPSPWFQTVLVDKGRDNGVVMGLPVINAQGIVGLVVEVTQRYAKVMLITDPNSAVDAVVQKSRARGIIKGGTSGYCVFNYVLRKHDLDIGDTVISSGMDGVFPKGLAIGQIADIVKKDSSIFQEVTVRPHVDFERLEEVLIVLTKEPDDPS